MKQPAVDIIANMIESPPARGARIETRIATAGWRTSRRSPPARGARIETIFGFRHTYRSSRPPRGGRGLKPEVIAGRPENLSRPPRGGRGLKQPDVRRSPHPPVAPRAGGRGLKQARTISIACAKVVAPRAGGAD